MCVCPVHVVSSVVGNVPSSSSQSSRCFRQTVSDEAFVPVVSTCVRSDPFDSCAKDPGVKELRSIEELKKSPVFEPGVGLVKGVKASLVLKKDAKPIMFKPRTIPYAMKKRVEGEYDGMVKAGILVKVDDSPWGTPVVPVFEGAKTRICGDYKATLNKVIETRQYPLPSLEECFVAVAGGEKFSTIDIRKAYNNLELREEDKLLTTLSTHKGLYAWNRLPYGISSSTAIFQAVMDETLSGTKMTCCRVDDILVSGRDDAEHIKNLNEVISRLEARGFHCNLEKNQIYGR